MSTLWPRRPGAHPADREIARLAIPALAALIAEPLFLLADSAIIGHLGTAQLAGLGIAGTVLGTSISVSIFLAYATTGAVARLVGAGDLRRGDVLVIRSPDTGEQLVKRAVALGGDTVRLDDGTSRVITEANAPAWRTGDKVRIVNGSIQSNA